jgi:phage gpG-like protein
VHRLQIEVHTNRILAGIDVLADTAPLARRAFPAICAVLSGAVSDVFEQQGMPAWQVLAEATVYERLRLGFNAVPIMIRSGSLLRSMTGEGEMHVENLQAAKEESVITFGSEDPRAVPLGRGSLQDNLPARPMFPPAQVLHPELQATIVAHAQGVVR